MKAANKIEKSELCCQGEVWSRARLRSYLSLLMRARNVGVVLIIGLFFTAIFLISNTIKITIIARRREIKIMRLVGATNSFIRWPFFLEGLWLGILGSILPIILISIAYYHAYDYIAPKLVGNFIKILPFTIHLFIRFLAC